LVTQAGKIFGSQCVVVAIDARQKIKNGKSKIDKWEVYINGGRTPTGLDVVEWAKKAQRLGAGEILLTSMDYDGTKDGFNLALTKAVSQAIKIPVIASGGAGKIEHFAEVFEQTKATAALAASIFHFREIKISAIKQYLTRKSIEVRS